MTDGGLLQYAFFQHALWGSLLASVLCGLVGTYVVTRRLVFVGGGIAHASLGGVGLGAFLGFPPLWGAAAFALFSGFGIQWLSRRREVREDSAIAMLWTFGMSVGILCAYLTPGFVTDLPSFLFGSILSVTSADLLALGVMACLALLLHLTMGRVVVAVAYDRDFTATQGLPVRFVEAVMTALTALGIVCSLHMMGIVLVISLLSVPQMAAGLFARTYGAMAALSVAFALMGSVGGLLLSYYYNVPSGATIVLLCIGIYFVAKAIKQLCPCLFTKSPA